ncbi:MAG: CpsD/CapB family tyrosine-protein kinase [Myxococcota bacterium]|nr:CpsD/CapB family tyrosine-protein kinase [Myxococcales bacterium]
MAKVYEAMKRAEEERKRKLGADASAPAPVHWDDAASDVLDEPQPRASFFQRWFRRNPTNAVIDTANDVNKRRIAILQPDSYVAEQFRMLRGRIDSVAAQRPIRTIAVTSANAHEGKSTASINLAIVTAMSLGRRVLLVDCDLRRPKIATSLAIDARAGLAEILLDRNTLDEAVVKVDNLNLDVVGVRFLPPNPSELLASPRMQAFIEEAASRYDRVIFDTPATLGLPDAKIVSELCDGLVMVVRADVTPREDVHAALEVLDRRRVLGLVLNGVDQTRERYGYY